MKKFLLIVALALIHAFAQTAHHTTGIPSITFSETLDMTGFLNGSNSIQPTFDFSCNNLFNTIIIHEKNNAISPKKNIEGLEKELFTIKEESTNIKPSVQEFIQSNNKPDTELLNCKKLQISNPFVPLAQSLSPSEKTTVLMLLLKKFQTLVVLSAEQARLNSNPHSSGLFQFDTFFSETIWRINAQTKTIKKNPTLSKFLNSVESSDPLLEQCFKELLPYLENRETATEYLHSETLKELDLAYSLSKKSVALNQQPEDNKTKTPDITIDFKPFFAQVNPLCAPLKELINAMDAFQKCSTAIAQSKTKNEHTKLFLTRFIQSNKLIGALKKFKVPTCKELFFDSAMCEKLQLALAALLINPDTLDSKLVKKTYHYLEILALKDNLLKEPAEEPLKIVYAFIHKFAQKTAKFIPGELNRDPQKVINSLAKSSVFSNGDFAVIIKGDKKTKTSLDQEIQNIAPSIHLIMRKQILWEDIPGSIKKPTSKKDQTTRYHEITFCFIPFYTELIDLIKTGILMAEKQNKTSIPFGLEEPKKTSLNKKKPAKKIKKLLPKDSSPEPKAEVKKDSSSSIELPTKDEVNELVNYQKRKTINSFDGKLTVLYRPETKNSTTLLIRKPKKTTKISVTSFGLNTNSPEKQDLFHKAIVTLLNRQWLLENGRLIIYKNDPSTEDPRFNHFSEKYHIDPKRLKSGDMLVIFSGYLCTGPTIAYKTFEKIKEMALKDKLPSKSIRNHLSSISNPSVRKGAGICIIRDINNIKTVIHSCFHETDRKN